MSYQQVSTNIITFEQQLWPIVKEIIRYRSNELLAWTRMRFLSSKSGISVGGKSGRLASSGSVVEPYRRGFAIYGGIKYDAKDPKTGYNYARSHFRLPGQSGTVVIVPRNKQALAIPIEGAGSTYGGNTFARAGMLFIRNSFDQYDFTPVAILKQRVSYPRRIDVEAQLYPYILPKIQEDITQAVNSYRAK
jgi:hypothetical protein